jgi:hypothetical protein
METIADSRCSDKHSAQHLAAQTLPDDVLLGIFNCHRQASIEDGPWKWHRLAQVCRRWRSVVFAYPRHLDLRIVSTYDKPIRNAPKFWPVLPVIIWYPHLRTAASHMILTPSDEDNISDILKNPARICEMDLVITRPLLAKLASSLRESFPALDHLRLRSQDSMYTIILPDEFLDGSAPRLRILHLKGIAIPMLPRILSSSKNLISLRLEDIKLDGYFTAEDIAIGHFGATQLKSLVLAFLPDTITPFSLRRSPSPLFSRIDLPALTEFRYEGEASYLRYFLSRINAPIIEQISVLFFYDAAYDTHELCELFGLGDALRSSRCLTTHIHLSRYHIVFSHHFSRIPSSQRLFRLQLPYQTHRPVPPLVTQVCLGLESQDLLPNVIHLEIDGCPERFRRDPACWLDLLRTLKGLKTLDVIGELGSGIAFALAQVTGETVHEIMPALQELHFGPETPSSTPTSLGPFITQRQLHGLPVSVHFKKLNWR